VLEQVALVRLVPPDARGWDAAEVQAVHMRRRDHAGAKRGIIRDAGDHERDSKARRQRLGRHLDDAGVGKQELAVGERVVGLAADDGRQQVGTAVGRDDAAGVAQEG